MIGMIDTHDILRRVRQLRKKTEDSKAKVDPFFRSTREYGQMEGIIIACNALYQWMLTMAQIKEEELGDEPQGDPAECEKKEVIE